jgi:AcrR family transcriptional regulator
VAAPSSSAANALARNQAARRRRVLDAALRLAEGGGFEAVQMRDVAAEADVALGTVYRYFVSKEHLFAAVLLEWSASLDDRVQRRPLVGETPATRLDDLMDRVLTAFERYPQFLRLIIVLETTPDPYARELHAEFSSHTGTTFLEPLEHLDPTLAEDILDVVKAVLWTLLRGWSQGLFNMREARRRMACCIDLIFSPSPSAPPSTAKRRK